MPKVLFPVPGHPPMITSLGLLRVTSTVGGDEKTNVRVFIFDPAKALVSTSVPRRTSTNERRLELLLMVVLELWSFPDAVAFVLDLFWGGKRIIGLRSPMTAFFFDDL